MRRRVMGGIAGWIIGALPLVGINVATYLGYYFENPVLIGAVALVAGLMLGGVAAGMLGGRSSQPVAGAGVAGGIAALLYAISIISLIVIAPNLGLLQPLTTIQLIHIVIAVIFCAVLLLGVSLLTGLLIGRGRDSETGPQPIPPYQNTLSKPRLPSRMYNNSQGSPPPTEPGQRVERRRSGPNSSGNSARYPGYTQTDGFGENYDGRGHQPTYPGRPTRTRQVDRDRRGQ